MYATIIVKYKMNHEKLTLTSNTTSLHMKRWRRGSVVECRDLRSRGREFESQLGTMA